MLSALSASIDTTARIAPDPWARGHDSSLTLISPCTSGAVTIAGHALMAAGICFVLRPTPGDVALATVLGALVGVLRRIGNGWVRVQMIMRVVAAFVVASITFTLAEHGWGDADLRAMIAPLVTFLPGAALTMGVVELSAAQIVTGSTRLVSGALPLVLLAFGLVAAAQAFGLPTASSLAEGPENLLGGWVAPVGVIVFALGVWIHESAPPGSLPGLLLVLLVAFTGQAVGNAALGPYLGGFIGAFVMTRPPAWSSARRPDRRPWSRSSPPSGSWCRGHWG